MKRSILPLLVAVGLIGSASAASSIITGNGSSDIDYSAYLIYSSLTNYFQLPPLKSGEYYSHGEFTLNFGFNPGVSQDYQNESLVYVNFNSLQNEQWIPNSSLHQSHTFTLNTNTLSAISALGGNNPYVIIDLLIPSSLDKFIQSVYFEVDSYMLTVNIIPEPSTYALFGIGAIGMLMALRRKKTA